MTDRLQKSLPDFATDPLPGTRWVISAVLICLMLASFLPQSSLATENTTYLDGQTRFEDISNPDRQAEAWAVCAAAYDVMSTIMRESAPDKSRQLHNLANGAQVSIGMALAGNDIDLDTDAGRLSRLWNANMAAMMDLPQQKLADILEEGQAMGDQRAEEFGRKINATVFACIDNLDTQRDYVETWQKLAEQGLVQPPEE